MTSISGRQLLKFTQKYQNAGQDETQTTITKMSWLNGWGKRGKMIVRMWHGRVPTSKARLYREFLNQRAIPDYQSVTGNISVHILERRDDEITHFITMTFWENIDVIKSFSGEDVEVAKYYPEDKEYLLEFEPTVVHYQVVGQAP